MQPSNSGDFLSGANCRQDLQAQAVEKDFSVLRDFFHFIPVLTFAATPQRHRQAGNLEVPPAASCSLPRSCLRRAGRWGTSRAFTLHKKHGRFQDGMLASHVSRACRIPVCGRRTDGRPATAVHTSIHAVSFALPSGHGNRVCDLPSRVAGNSCPIGRIHTGGEA